MMTKNKRIWVSVLCLIGLALSVELCIVYYNANFVQDAAPSICAISESMDCDGVAKTAYSQFFGVPLALWGVFLYLFILFMTFVDKIKKLPLLGFLQVFKNQQSYICCLSALAFILSMCLACISVFKIDSICLFCLMTYFVDLIIALVTKEWKIPVTNSSLDSFSSLDEKQNYKIDLLFELKNSINDFIDAIKVPKYALSFLAVVSVFVGFLYVTSNSNILAPQLERQKMFQAMANSVKLAQYNGNELGNPNANIIIHEYMDFNCGGCFLAHIYLHRIVSEFENVKVIQHNLPLERVCNSNMQHEGHKNSCLKSKYALAAKKQNKYWQMADIIYIDSPDDEKQILEAARLADFDIKKLKEDAHSEAVAKEIQEGIAEANSKGIYGTPTLIIGIKTMLGVKKYEEFKQTIIELGGKEKASHG